jgi:hypothetical protein
MRASFRFALYVAAPAALLAACVPQPVAPPAASPPPPVARPAPQPVAAKGSSWNDWPWTPGTWTYRRDTRGSLALFGPVGGDALLTLRCDLGQQQIYLSRAGTAPAPLTIRTTSLTRAVPVQPTGGTPAYVAAALTPNDGLLDAMGFSRGRFVVEQAGAATLVVPTWAEIERVTEDCRG